jgi:predicted GNAT superfamily acetyltransferase
MLGQTIIKPVTSLDHYRQVEALQRQIWHFATDIEIVPLHVLKAAAENGGVLLGAFSPQDDLIGFVMGFRAEQDGQPKHYSHMLGVLPQAQGAGIGYRLKCAQREAVLAQGLDRITWTVDPLESRNARLNLGKLGVVCNTYHVNWYGEMQDQLNVGMPTDRFQVDWWLRDQRVEQRVRQKTDPPALLDMLVSGADRVNRTQLVGSVRLPSSANQDSTSESVLIEIPADFQAVKQQDLQAARKWRLHTRELFQSYFRAGYTATESVSEIAREERRSFYLLQRNPPLAR